MNEEQHSFLHRIFFGNQEGTEREQKVLEYAIHRVNEGAHLRDVLQEEYIRRNASPNEIEQILENPKLIEAAHEQMRDDFSSGRLAPNPPPPGGAR